MRGAGSEPPLWEADPLHSKLDVGPNKKMCSRQSPESMKKRNSSFKAAKGNDELEPIGKSVFDVLLQRNPGAAEEILNFGISTNSQVIFF